MAYLDVYGTIFYYLEGIGIVDDIIEESEKILFPFIKRVKNKTKKPNSLFNEYILEYALFHYNCEGKLLIDFLTDSLYPKLQAFDKEQFKAIRKSERLDLRFDKKIRTGELDTNGKPLYDFHFQDIETRKIKIVSSSTPLDRIMGKSFSARLVKYPKKEGKYILMGLLCNLKAREYMACLKELKSYVKNNGKRQKRKLKSLRI